MAYSFAAISADKKSLYDADKPLFVPINQLNGNIVSTQWNSSSGRAGTNRTDSAAPVSRTYDYFGHLYSQPSNVDGEYLSIQVSPIEFDSLIIISNGNTHTGVNVCIADDLAMSTNKLTIASDAYASTQRTANYALNHAGSGITGPVVYSNVEFIEIRFLGITAKPQIGEIWFGKRRDIRYKPNEPWDQNSIYSSINSFESGSGVRIAYERYRGQRRTKPTFLVDTTAANTEHRAFWDDTNKGHRNFIYAESPNLSPTHTYLMYHERSSYVSTLSGGPNLRLINYDMREQPPFRAEDIST